MTDQTWDERLRLRLGEWQSDGLARELKIATGKGVRVELNGRKILSFATNDYLGLSSHPEVIAAAKAALDKSGAGSRASPLIVGHRTEHTELEGALAAFKQSEAALVFPSGYQAAVATLSCLVSDSDTIILDRLSHASLIDGARLSGARVRTFKHNDMSDLRRLLELNARENRREDETSKSEIRKSKFIVVVESLYSMDGDTAPLEVLIKMCEDHGALLLVDEAHATGVLGNHGRGLLEASTAANGALPRHVLAMGTLSKALGSQGGFLCASKPVIDTIVHSGRAYLFSTALAPASAAGALAALKLIDSEPERRRHLLECSELVRSRLREIKLEIVPSTGPIIPIVAGTETRATEWSRALLEHGIFVPAIRYPTVKKGQARLRISLSAAHTREDCEELLKACAALKSTNN
jgi:8-amino-7-oxononanoate synthase